MKGLLNRALWYTSSHKEPVLLYVAMDKSVC